MRFAKTYYMTELTNTLWTANPFESILAELQGMTKPSIEDEVVYHTDCMVGQTVIPFWVHNGQVWRSAMNQVGHRYVLSTMSMSFVEDHTLPGLGQYLFHDIPQLIKNHISWQGRPLWCGICHPTPPVSITHIVKAGGNCIR
jgi:hypothetical protein